MKAFVRRLLGLGEAGAPAGHDPPNVSTIYFFEASFLGGNRPPGYGDLRGINYRPLPSVFISRGGARHWYLGWTNNIEERLESHDRHLKIKKGSLRVWVRLRDTDVDGKHDDGRHRADEASARRAIEGVSKRVNEIDGLKAAVDAAWDSGLKGRRYAPLNEEESSKWRLLSRSIAIK